MCMSSESASLGAVSADRLFHAAHASVALRRLARDARPMPTRPGHARWRARSARPVAALAGGPRRGRRRCARDRRPRRRRTRRFCGSLPRRACPRSARSRSRSTLATLDSLTADVDRAGIFVQIGFQRRFDAGYRAARDAVARGALGTLLVVRAATHDPAPPAEAYIAASGGIFRDLHIHDFDAVRFVTGQEIVEVYADGAVRETRWFERHGDVDTAVAALRLSGGALGDPLGRAARRRSATTCASRSSAPATASPSAATARSPLRSVEPGAAAAGRPGYRNFLERFEPAYRAELAAFVAAVRDGGPTSPCSLHEARTALRVALAADRSRAETAANRDRGGDERANSDRLKSSQHPVAPDKESGHDERRSRRDDRADQGLAPRPPRQRRRRSSRPDGTWRPRRGRVRRRRGRRRHQGRGRHPRRHRLVLVGVQEGRRPGREGPQGRGVSVTQVYANNDVAKQVSGINAAIAARREDHRDIGAGRERPQGSADQGVQEGHPDHHRQLRPRRLRRPAGLHGARRPDRGDRGRGRRQAVQGRRCQEGADRDPRGLELGPRPARATA